MSRHCHFIVQAYENKSDTGMLSDMASVDVIADSEKQALKRAEVLVKKSHYRVSQVVEHDPDAELATLGGAQKTVPNGAHTDDRIQ